MRWLWRSPVFWVGLCVLLFLGWAWRDGATCVSTASCNASKVGVQLENGEAGLGMGGWYRPGGTVEWDADLNRRRRTPLPEVSSYLDPEAHGVFPRGVTCYTWIHARGGGDLQLFFAHWLLLLLAVSLWLAVLGWGMWRRRGSEI